MYTRPCAKANGLTNGVNRQKKHNRKWINDTVQEDLHTAGGDGDNDDDDSEADI